MGTSDNVQCPACHRIFKRNGFRVHVATQHRNIVGVIFPAEVGSCSKPINLPTKLEIVQSTRAQELAWKAARACEHPEDEILGAISGGIDSANSLRSVNVCKLCGSHSENMGQTWILPKYLQEGEI